MRLRVRCSRETVKGVCHCVSLTPIFPIENASSTFLGLLTQGLTKTSEKTRLLPRRFSGRGRVRCSRLLSRGSRRTPSSGRHHHRIRRLRSAERDLSLLHRDRGFCAKAYTRARSNARRVVLRAWVSSDFLKANPARATSGRLTRGESASALGRPARSRRPRRWPPPWGFPERGSGMLS